MHKRLLTCPVMRGQVLIKKVIEMGVPSTHLTGTLTEYTTCSISSFHFCFTVHPRSTSAFVFLTSADAISFVGVVSVSCLRPLAFTQSCR